MRASISCYMLLSTITTVSVTTATTTFDAVTTATTTFDACIKTALTFDQGARCLSSNGAPTGATSQHKTVGWCCSEVGRTNNYQWNVPSTPITTASVTTATTTFDACIKTALTFDQGARCVSSNGAPTGATSQRKTVGWCCSENGRTNKYQWNVPSTLTPKRLCTNVGDPHITKFDGTQFDTHRLGWKTLYKYGQLEIQCDQATWKNTGGLAAINRAVRYSTNGGTTWDETIKGGLLLATGADKSFTNPDVYLKVDMVDHSTASWAQEKFYYNVYVTTSAYTNATGQCVQGKLRRRLDVLTFPSGTDVKVTEQEAETACTGLKDQKQNCITDIRIANDPAFTNAIKNDFVKVEKTVEILKATISTTTAPAAASTSSKATDVPTIDVTVPPTDLPTKNITLPPLVDDSGGISTTTQCLSALAALVLLVL